MSDKGRTRRAFNYKPPTYDGMRQRAEDTGGMFDSILKQGIKTFKAKEGASLIRILPPTWENAEHYGYPIFIHGGVGPENRQYLCLIQNEASPYDRCPICEELYRLGARISDEEKRLLRATRRMVYYIINRDNESEGVVAWVTSNATDSEIATQSINRRNHSVLDIVNIDNGYDIEFTRTGTTFKNTRYKGFQVMREKSPLSDRETALNKWLDFIEDNPIPSILNFVSPEKIEKVFKGSASSEEEEGPTRSRIRDQDERPPIRRTREEDEDEIVEEEEKPVRRRRVAEDSEPEEEPRPRRRTALQEELDDEIPFDRSKRSRGSDPDDVRKPSSNIKEPDEEENEPAPRRRRRDLDDDDDEEEIRPRRRRVEAEEENGEPEPESRKDRNDAVRQRLRERLNRE